MVALPRDNINYNKVSKYSKTRLLRISRDFPFYFAISVIRTKHITNFNEIVVKLRSKRVYKEI